MVCAGNPQLYIYISGPGKVPNKQEITRGPYTTIKVCHLPQHKSGTTDKNSQVCTWVPLALVTRLHLCIPFLSAVNLRFIIDEATIEVRAVTSASLINYYPHHDLKLYARQPLLTMAKLAWGIFFKYSSRAGFQEHGKSGLT